MSRDRRDLSELCRVLGYSFCDERLLRNALTHSSYCYEHKLSYNENNERLEFLGDAVFDAVIADELYVRLTDNEEGDLSRLRASVVCEQSLFRKAEELHLVDYMRLGHGEQISFMHKKNRSLQRMPWRLPSVLSTVTEAGKAYGASSCVSSAM